jgi:hypothetical protein
MATPQQLGTLDTLSAPHLYNGMIWFQGTDNKLMVMPMDDPSKAFNVGGLKTQSEPVPVANRYMAFRGEGDRVMLVTTDPPYVHGQVGSAKCLSAPVPCGPFLYFQGPGNSLSRCRYDHDLLEPILVNGQPVTGCTDRPAISDTHRDRLFYTAGDEVAPTTLGHSVLHCVDLKGRREHHEHAEQCQQPLRSARWEFLVHPFRQPGDPSRLILIGNTAASRRTPIRSGPA